MKFLGKLSNPFALAIEGFVAGVILFTALPVADREAQPAPASAASAYQLPQA